MKVPLIDISAIRGGSEASKRATAATLDAAAREIGFFAVTGHGVPDALCEEAAAAALEFFALPMEQKRRVARPTREESRGYAAIGGEALGQSLGGAALSDLKETFAIGPVDSFPPALLGAHAYPHYTPNVWPAHPARLRPAWEAYYRACWRLADEVLALLSLALGLPEGWFQDKTDHCYSNRRAQHYPPLRTPALPGQLRAGAHTDYGVLTVLRGEASVSGLQVQAPSGAWIDVAFPADGFVVNIGDQMAMWSNDRWRSTLHRVVVPEDEAERRQGRLSIGFFHMPNADAEIACLPGCTSPDSPAKYPPISAGWHKRLKFAMANDLPDIVAAAPESARRAVAAR